MKRITFIILQCLWLLSPLLAQSKIHYELDYSRYAEKIVSIKGTFEGFATCNLSMFVHPVKNVPEGEAAYVQNLEVRDAQNQVISAQYTQEGEWKVKVSKQATFSIRYEIRLEHDAEEWFEAGGVDEVSYSTADGFFSTGYALFIFPNVEDLAAIRDVTVRFVLPTGWKASTPWKSIDNQSFQPSPDLRFLLNNCLFVGSHEEQTVVLDDFELRMAIGKQYIAQKTLFIDLMKPMLAETKKLFGGALQKQYLIVIGAHNMTDGSAFRQSFSQIIKGEVNLQNRITWGQIMAHETFHLWNGHALQPAEQLEWFKEGITDYMTNVLLSRLQILDTDAVLKRLEKAYTRYLVSKFIQKSPFSLQEAGNQKQEQRFLVYGGGLLFGFALDIEIRQATQNQKGLDDLLKKMYEKFAVSGQKYTYKDIVEIANSLTNKDLTPFFEKYLQNPNFTDYLPYFQQVGIEANAFFEELYLAANASANEEQKAMRKSIFGF